MRLLIKAASMVMFAFSLALAVLSIFATSVWAGPTTPCAQMGPVGNQYCGGTCPSSKPACSKIYYTPGTQGRWYGVLPVFWSTRYVSPSID